MFSYWIWWVSNVRNEILSNYISSLEGIIGGNVEPNKPVIGSQSTNSNEDTNKTTGLEGNVSNFITE
jgi:hypothetical protein